jgi:hypothetical protein
MEQEEEGVGKGGRGARRSNCILLMERGRMKMETVYVVLSRQISKKNELSNFYICSLPVLLSINSKGDSRFGL